MSRPKRMTRWYVTAYGALGTPPERWWVPSLRRWMPLTDARATGRIFCSTAYARTRRQALRIAAKMPDTSCALITLRCSRKSRKWPKGFERDYGARGAA